MKNEHNVVRTPQCDDCDEGNHQNVQHFWCKKSGCFFESDDLSDVAQHVVENQFPVK